MNYTSLRTALLILSVLMLSIGICSAFSISLIVAFLGGVLPVLLLGIRQGQRLQTLMRRVVESLWRIRGLFMIITLMGASIAMWLSSGAVAYLMQQGSALTRGAFFLPAAYLICALSSVSIGTALGTFSTIGLAFYGMGKSMGLPDGILIGTLVSGVFLADRLAPMSGLVNLTLKRTGLTYPEYFRHSWKRVFFAVLVSAGAYTVIGLVLPPGVSGAATTLSEIVGGFRLSPLLWLLPLLTFVLALRGVTTIRTLAAGVVTGFGFTLFLQERSLGTAVQFLFKGYSDELGILKGGGVLGIAEVLGIVGLAVVYNELLSETGITRTLLQHLASGVSSINGMKRRIGAFSIALTSLTCDQTVGILLPLEAMKPYHADGRITPVEAAVLVSDTGTLIAPLEFWNVNALVIMALTGIPAWQYGPWVFFCWLLPLMALVWPMHVRKA